MNRQKNSKINLLICVKISLFIMTTVFALSISAKNKQTIILENANVIDVASGMMSRLNIKIKDGKIIKVSTDKIRGDVKINLKGKYILPHLWDMHVHSHGKSEALEKHMIAGILGIRDMGAFQTDKINFLQKNDFPSDSNKDIPKIFYAGFIHNGKECEVEEHKSVDTFEELKNAVRFQKENNLSFFKIHNCFPMSLFPNLEKLAERENIKIVSHIPQGFDPIEYAKFNVSSIEHIDILMRALLFRKDNPAKSVTEAVKILDGDYLDNLADVLVKNKVAITPTLVAHENYVNNLPNEHKKIGNALLDRLKKYTKRLSDRGVLILAGTDLGLPGLEPGDSLIREIEFMVEAGISNQEALKTATINPAKYLGINNLSVSKNSKADFIILHKNPLENIENLKNIHAVVKNGDYKIIN